MRRGHNPMNEERWISKHSHTNCSKVAADSILK